MDLDDARRVLADLGVPDLDAHLHARWESIETGPVWAWEQDLLKSPPDRREYPDEDSLARDLVVRAVTYRGLPVPADPLPPRAWTVERPDRCATPGRGPSLLWATGLVSGSTVAAPDPDTLLVRDLSSWYDHLTAGAAVVRTVDLATGTQTDLRADNDMFALGRVTGPRPRVRIPWRKADLPPAVRPSPGGGPSVDITSVPDAIGTARYLIVRREDSRHPAEGIRLEIWG